jgi:hypothetical protein
VREHGQSNHAMGCSDGHFVLLSEEVKLFIYFIALLIGLFGGALFWPKGGATMAENY